MRNYQQEFDNRVKFIRQTVEEAGADGIVFGNSGGKDSALVGILCKAACSDTVGIIMPCSSGRNYGEDKSDAEKLAARFAIETRIIDLTEVKNSLVSALRRDISQPAGSNIAPRLRMTALYAVAMNENRLVAGTGNRSEIYMGYFTKWGDGACDFNPVADLTVSEVFEFLQFLGCPENILTKAPSAGLFEGQTDETDMGISYKKIDNYLLSDKASETDKKLIENYHSKTEHKRNLPKIYNM
ncbi:MAG: NAD(+) synthase [Oscillospiraceae bacterium]|nr:NAD(+) synthase [Oscillospiraceae bacterium]